MALRCVALIIACFSLSKGAWCTAVHSHLKSALNIAFRGARPPRRHTRPLCTRSSVPSAAPSCGAWESPTALNHHKPKPGTHPHEHAGRPSGPPCTADAAHACPAHRSRSPAVQQQHTTAHTRRESRTGHPQVRRQHGSPGITSSRRRPQRSTSNQRLQNRPSTATTPGRPTLPGRTPSYNPTTRDRATHSTNACRSGKPAGRALT